MAEPRGPLASPGYWLHHAALAWSREVGVRLRPLGLTPTQFNLLASASWLEGTDGTPTQQGVADLAGADRIMASKVVGTLEARGLLERLPDPADARLKRLHVTDAGRRLVHAAVRLVAEVDEEFFGPPGRARDDARRRFRRLVER